MSTSILIQGLSKKFNRNGGNSSYVALRDILANAFTGKHTSAQSFWALEDINLNIEAGERIGVIGRNGAGKSTLLKIISRITPPTKGRIEINGKVASLLEVGTGFHPELTGLENIYLNGSILGLKKKEIRTKIDEIIDFSGVQDFINTPLKHYSTGMQLRLAFAVAAHLESDILMIDEVLAVGDLEFQRKCIGKMDEISKQNGRTILFVSHNLEAINKFCEKAVWLDRGKLKKSGSADEIVRAYIQSQTNFSKDALLDNVDKNDVVRLLNIETQDSSGQSTFIFKTTDSIAVKFTYDVAKTGLLFTHGINLYNEQGVNIFDSHDNHTSIRLQDRMAGVYQATVWIPANLLPEGNFSVGVALFSQQPFYILLHHLHLINFTVIDDLSGKSARGSYSGDYGGLVRPLLRWDAKKMD